ncbi:Large ribosomal subunit protein bL28 - like 1 [Theobroma cacao]|uniref:Large ribosomal subunit protein bL28c n=1 Tax=Theobroma cacao TaxID=3641 RepID=A0A061FPY6_THECC|nr:Ribosomal L28 family [Theobroma cacao]WRX11857.1 Large ribosomal subunit protein bL28 - like 1 [Theobroma cacao]
MSSSRNMEKTPPIFLATLRATFTSDFRRVCPFTGKKANKANKVSFSNHKTKKLQFVNLQCKKVWWEAGKRYIKLRLSTKALKTIEKNGLDAVAKKAGIDLRKE